MYNLSIGVIVQLEDVLEKGAESLFELGLDTCQLACWHPSCYTKENAEKVKAIFKDKMNIVSFWAGWTGPIEWNFINGPSTLGIVPEEYRQNRIEELKQGADFAHLLGIKDVITHLGFIPENPKDRNYLGTVEAVREIALHCEKKGQYFDFETGQETPITMMRLIEDVGLPNLGVNLDPANLLLYGKANPVDAVSIFKNKVRGIHVKDGQYPTNGKELGKETAVGEGLVNFHLLIKGLHSYGYNGPLIIEREISGAQQKEDILKAKELLNLILTGIK